MINWAAPILARLGLAQQGAIVPLSNELVLLLQAFGPVAFGVISLLIIWARIVGPELAAQRQMMIAVAQLTADLKVSIDRLEIMAEHRGADNVR